jgi:RimJ/RimL family protein N-acetyltransferase
VNDATGQVALRDPREEDFEIIFAMTQDPIGNEMSKVYARSREEFREQWDVRTTSPSCVVRTITLNDEVVGRVNSFDREGVTNVGYLIARAHWGKGVMSSALRQFVQLVEHRPLLARAAKSNIGSCRVLEKCDFRKIEERDSPETPRYIACVECVYLLE